MRPATHLSYVLEINGFFLSTGISDTACPSGCALLRGLSAVKLHARCKFSIFTAIFIDFKGIPNIFPQKSSPGERIANTWPNIDRNYLQPNKFLVIFKYDKVQFATWRVKCRRNFLTSSFEERTPSGLCVGIWWSGENKKGCLFNSKLKWRLEFGS